MNRTLTVLLFAILFLGAPGLTGDAAAATYYVSPGACSDGNAGTTAAAPWCTPPGTKTVSNSGFLRGAWGSLTTANKVRCGDTILLKGGSTHSSQVGGSWSIDQSYYTGGCAGSSPITITVATNTEWGGSSGDFTFNASGISAVGINSGSNTPCSGGTMCGMISVEGLATVLIGGRSSSQRLILENVTDSGSGDVGGVTLFNGQRHEVRWMLIRNRGFFSMGGAISTGDIDNSVVHDIVIDNWRGGPGIQAGMMAARYNRSVGFVDVLAKNSGVDDANAPNAGGDAFQFGGGNISDSMGGNGGIWCVRCVLQDYFWNGSNSGGNTSGSVDAVYKYRGFRAIGAGRTVAASSVQSGFESGGDTNCVGQESLVVITHSVFYNNRNHGWTAPHGGGVAVLLNNTFFRGGAGGTDLRYDASACNITWMNNIVQTAGLPFAGNVGNNSVRADRIPKSDYNLVDFWGSASDTFSLFRFSGSSYQQGSSVSFNNVAQSGWKGVNDRISTSTRRYLPLFNSAAGNCNTGFVSGQVSANFATCDLTLRAGSDAIDAATFWFRANGAGTNATTIVVVPNGQIGQNAADPRHYFIEPDSFWRADLLAGAGSGFGDTIQIEGCGPVRITNMTATTITFIPACSWANNAGISLPWTGSRPDIGAFESGGTGNALAAPKNLRIIP